jgi:hypothetical protein
MKKLVLILAFALSTSLVFAQGTNQSSALTRKEKRQARLESQYRLTKDMIENKNFVLESDFLQNRYGYSFPVSPNINFVKVEPNNEAVIQIGSNYRIGPNGVGGVTAKGKITKWQVIQNKKNDTFDVKMFVMTPIGMYDVNFSVMPGGQATARLTGMRGGRLTFDGNLVPTDQSITYEGWSI